MHGSVRSGTRSAAFQRRSPARISWVGNSIATPGSLPPSPGGSSRTTRGSMMPLARMESASSISFSWLNVFRFQGFGFNAAQGSWVISVFFMPCRVLLLRRVTAAESVEDGGGTFHVGRMQAAVFRPAEQRPFFRRQERRQTRSRVVTTAGLVGHHLGRVCSACAGPGGQLLHRHATRVQQRQDLGRDAIDGAAHANSVFSSLPSARRRAGSRSVSRARSISCLRVSRSRSPATGSRFSLSRLSLQYRASSFFQRPRTISRKSRSSPPLVSQSWLASNFVHCSSR